MSYFCREWNSGHLSHSQSLCILRYPGSFVSYGKYAEASQKPHGIASTACDLAVSFETAEKGTTREVGNKEVQDEGKSGIGRNRKVRKIINKKHSREMYNIPLKRE
jgi:hypothetical protein